MGKKHFKCHTGKIPLPIFFPDATRAVVKTLDSKDIKNTKTPGILVNTYHLIKELGEDALEKHGSIRDFMNWNGAIISDSGGFQVMSLAKKGLGKVTDLGVYFQESKKKRLLLTPEKSIKFQAKLKTDLMVCLDDFTPPRVSRKTAQDTIRRTIKWAKRCKDEYRKIFSNIMKRPYLIAVVQGGKYLDLRRDCATELAKIGFDGYGYGGWPLKENGEFDLESAKVIADNTPKNALLYGLGIGKPEDIVKCVKLGYQIFDCVLPTRDARHGRLYVYNAKKKENIDVEKPNFYSFFNPKKTKYLKDKNPVSRLCDCLLCNNYSRGYLAHLFRVNDTTAMRLATIHNLRFYSMLMEKLR